MFDRIVGRYDLLNRLLSMRRDVAWRKRMRKHLPEGKGLRLLDCATGTADVLITCDAQPGKIAKGWGVDMSTKMLERGKEKLAAKGKAGRFPLAVQDVMALGFGDNTFDAATIAFGVRNMTDVPLALREMHRVLKPGGRAVIAEMSLPEGPLRRPYLWYFRNVLPRLGAAVSGNGVAYTYLNRTVETFPYGEAFLALMRDAGFTNCRAQPLTFGIAHVYSGEK
jgi:demethylmenaquinone methyltransferase/2-methoxy-6-polyprenyl-1,4-benzoquinol methylase